MVDQMCASWRYFILGMIGNLHDHHQGLLLEPVLLLLQDFELMFSGQYRYHLKATATSNAMLTILETLSRIHDHHPEHLPEPVHLLLLGKCKTLNTSVLVNMGIV